MYSGRQKQFQIAVRSRGFWLDRSPNSSAYGKRWGGEDQDEDESDVKTYKSLDGIQNKLGRFYRMKGYSMGNEYDMWNSGVEDAAESLGNESRPHSERNVYVRYAIIVEPSNLEVSRLAVVNSLTGFGSCPCACAPVNDRYLIVSLNLFKISPYASTAS
jgi:hypothetical protein